MEDDFYATIKLSSGEEILGKVCYLPDEDKILIDRPLLVEVAKTKKGNVEVSGFSLKEWINATFENMFIIEVKSGRSEPRKATDQGRFTTLTNAANVKN